MNRWKGGKVEKLKVHTRICKIVPMSAEYQRAWHREPAAKKKAEEEAAEAIAKKKAEEEAAAANKKAEAAARTAVKKQQTSVDAKINQKMGQGVKKAEQTMKKQKTSVHPTVNQKAGQQSQEKAVAASDQQSEEVKVEGTRRHRYFQRDPDRAAL